MIAEIALGAYVVAHLSLALWVSFDSKGGAEGQVPVLIHGVGLPLIGLSGLAIVDITSPEWSLPAWGYVLAFPISVVLLGWVICRVGELGEFVARRHGRAG